MTLATPLSTPSNRGPDDPLPTVAQIEDALDVLLTAIIKHQNKRWANRDPGKLPRLYWLGQPKRLPGESFINDPIGQSLRVGVTRLGQALFALTGSLAALHDACDRVSRRGDYQGWRGDIMDKRWDGIGNGNDRWGA
jgi:hypothetical protein